MGLRRLVMLVLGLSFASALFNPCFAASKVVLEKQPWLVEKACELCVPIQFGKLEMRLPLAEIGKILVIDGEKTVYLLAGNVTSKFYEAVLSNLRIVNLP